MSLYRYARRDARTFEYRLTTPRFLWASLQVSQILKHRTEAMMRKALQGMPTKIYDVFARTLERIGDNDLARRTLYWLARAVEPLEFPALAHALAVDLEDPKTMGVDGDNIPCLEDLVEICCGLVSIDSRQNIRFTHFTVQEYFTEHSEALLPLSDLIIAKTCLTYACFDEFKNGYCDSEEKVQQRLQMYPLYSFAVSHWAQYVSKVEEDEIEEYVLRIYQDPALFSSYAQVLFALMLPFEGDGSAYFEFQRGYTPIHDAAHVGIISVLKKLLPGYRGADCDTKTGISPLHFAVANNDATAISLLLDWGRTNTVTRN